MGIEKYPENEEADTAGAIDFSIEILQDLDGKFIFYCIHGHESTAVKISKHEAGCLAKYILNRI